MIKTELLDLHKLNILTKYPSIYTRHSLDNKGQASNDIEVQVKDEDVYYLTEKIDGTNSRIIIFPDNRYVIGSREEFLTADNDLIRNNTLGITTTVLPYAEHIKQYIKEHQDILHDNIIVIYGETFGGHSHKNGIAYSGDRSRYAFRMFDIQRISIETLNSLLEKDETRIATWREHNNQNWFTFDELELMGSLLKIPTVPFIAKLKGTDIPKEPEKMLDWIKNILPETKEKLDATAKGFAEGIICRTSDRKTILKIRNANYKKFASPVNTVSIEP